MEPVGIALGAAGLLVAFHSCLEALELIELGKSHARDITLMEQLFDNQQYRLLTWAKAYFPSVESSDPRLRNPEIRERILNNLKCISLLFQDRGRLRKRYGLKETEDTKASEVARRLPFQQQVKQFVSSVQQRQNTAKLGTISKWAVRDHRKFRELIDDLSRFITDLENTTHFLDQQHVQRRIVDLEIATLTDDERSLVAEATSEYGDMVSGAAIEYQARAKLVRQGAEEPCSKNLYLQPLPHAENLFDGEEDTISVLFADYGNSCRSPMAEAIFQRLTENLPKISTISSAGTGDHQALMPTDQRTVATLYRHGIDNTRRRPRQIIPVDFDDFTYILAMDSGNLAKLKRLDMQWQHVGSQPGKAEMRLFGSFGELTEEVLDPFSGGEDDFERVYEQIVRLSGEFLREVGALR